MNIETFFEARDLYDKYQLCEKVMKYLSDEESVKGQKYLETLKQFVDAFKMEFLMFVHERMEAVGMQFEDLHCPEHSEQPENPMPPAEPQDPKFPIGSKVEIVGGKFDGCIGPVMNYEPAVDGMVYYVKSDFNDNGTLFSMWFPESDLKAYVEESEAKPEDPTLKIKEGDIVEILSGEAKGKLAKVVYCDYADKDKTYRVEPIDDDFVGNYWYPEEDLELYTDPENPEENG